MKTKQEIIQRLLNEKHITVEEAMILMETTQYVLPWPSGYWTSTSTDKITTSSKTTLND
jgi:hypothetical protein